MTSSWWNTSGTWTCCKKFPLWHNKVDLEFMGTVLCVCVSVCAKLHACVFVRKCVSIQSDPFFKKQILLVLMRHLSCPGDGFILRAIRNSLVLVWIECGFTHVFHRALDLSPQELSHFLWGGKPGRTAQRLQGSNNKQGRLDYGLWSEATYCILKHLLPS